MKIYKENNYYSVIALILGIIGVLTWFMPLLSIILCGLSVIFGKVGITTKYHSISIAAIALAIIGIVFSLIKSGLVYFLA